MGNVLKAQNQDRGYLLTEQANPYSQNLDRLSALEIVELFNREDAFEFIGRLSLNSSFLISCFTSLRCFFG